MVRLNDEISVAEIKSLSPSYLVISPGPCTPNESGVALAAIEQLAGNIPIFGVCLGFQAIGQVFGAKVVRARQVMHGKTSQIVHREQGVFKGLKRPLTATRYHSLVLDQSTIPDDFEVTAWTESETGELDEVMAIKHRTLPLEGVQFHPESVLTECGHQLLNNFIESHSKQ